MCLRWIMGYVSRPSIISSYTPSDVVLVTNLTEKSTTNGTYVKLKEIELVQRVYEESRFRFKFDLRAQAAGRTGYGKIYKNGVAIGSEQTTVGATYVTKTEDINVGTWNVSDKIELWVHSQTGGLDVGYVYNFQLCGAVSPFINKVGM